MNHDLWLPEAHPKQLLAFNSIANEILYGGATRGGKSFYIRWAYCNWCSAVDGLQCDIFRLNFDDVIGDCMEGQYSFPELLAPLERRGLVKINQTQIKWWNGSLISLEHAGNADKVQLKHQGRGKHVRSFIEATQIPSSLIKWLRAWVTMPEEMKNKLPEQLKDLYPDLTPEQLRNFFPKIIYASNPIGPSSGYFRKYFVKARPRYAIEQAPADDGGFMRQYIPAKVEDNPSEDAEATKRRVSGMGDAAVADALLNENWDAPIGEYFPQWDDNVHAVPNCTPPDWFFKFRTFDWGSSEPFAVHWWFVADGTEFLNSEGESVWFPRGSLVCYREWYGAQESDGAKGIEMGNAEIAKGIVERTIEKSAVGWITLTDSLPFQERGMRKDDEKWKIADEFAANGCPLTMANTARVFGWKSLRDRLIGKEVGYPLFYVCYCAKYLRDYLPALQRSKTNFEDAQESGEATHCCDSARYASATKLLVTDKPIVVKAPPKGQSPSPVAILKQIKRQGYQSRRTV